MNQVGDSEGGVFKVSIKKFQALQKEPLIQNNPLLQSAIMEEAKKVQFEAIRKVQSRMAPSRFEQSPEGKAQNGDWQRKATELAEKNPLQLFSFNEILEKTGNKKAPLPAPEKPMYLDEFKSLLKDSMELGFLSKGFEIDYYHPQSGL